MKKIISFLLILCLFGCTASNKQDETIQNKREYIKPLNKVNLFDELNDKTKSELLEVYGEDAPLNNILKMFGKDLTDISVNDYYGDVIDFANFKDKEVIIEISQKICEHCQKQIPLTEEILKNEDDIFIQYFAFGTNEEIDEFYGRSSYKMPKELIVIPENEELSKYITDLDVDSTPTFLFCKNGVINFACIGETSYAKYLKAKELAFKNPLSRDSFVTNDGIDIFSLTRDYDDVLNDLSSDSKDKFAIIDNSEELTVNVIGKNVEFNTLYETGDDDPLYTIDNYAKYVNKPLVVFYLANIHENLENDIMLINTFAAHHPDLNMFAILMDNKDLQTSIPYAECKTHLMIDVVSSNAEIPKQLIDNKVNTYPAALFIQDNIFTGGVNSIASSVTIENAYEYFLGDDSIALVDNN